MNNELDQWCEIDGHEWNYHYLEHGLVLGPKSTQITKWCSKCKRSEVEYFVSKCNNYQLPIVGKILSW
jgi:hypothetical protein